MRITVEGRHPLNGVYHPSGNPNAAFALLAAAMLTDKPVTLHNMPRSANVEAMMTLADRMGANLTWDDTATLNISTPQITQRVLTEAETASSVSFVLLLAPILHHRQHVRVEFDFPLNRIRTHIDALRDLGIDVVTVQGAVECRASKWDFKEIILSQASVTATALVLMLAACQGVETIIHNAACEPHVRELAEMLVEMGAHIEGIGSNVLRILSPPEGLAGADITLAPDHIEVGSIAAISALCGGRVQIQGTRHDDMRMVAKIYQRLGIQLDMDDDAVFVPKHETLTIANREEDVDSSIETAIWPGFPSDLVAVATVITTQARGTCLIHEKLFNNRLLFVDRLKAMGAQIVLCDPHRAIVVGPTPLYGVYMDTPDVRTGLGMLGAALVANGTSVIDNAQVIERTFAGALAKLQALGARITVE